MNPVPSDKLKRDELTPHRARRLDPQNFNGAHGKGKNDQQWQELWDFARMFDGYAAFGGQYEAGERLSDFALSIRKAFKANGELPIGDVDLLRACLFYEQRYWCRWSGVLTERCPAEIAEYIDALLDAIEARVER